MNKVDIIVAAILSVGATVAIISTIFIGIKLRWFRYRMNIPHDSPVLLRAQSVTEIRENCSEGHYRQSFQEDVPIRGDSASQQMSSPPSSSSYSVKSKCKCRRSSNTARYQFTTFYQHLTLSTPKICVNEFYFVSYLDCSHLLTFLKQ